MKKFLFTIIFAVLINFAFAFPPLQVYQQGSVNINMPVSWQIQVDESQGLIYISENPNNPNSPEVYMMTAANTNNTTAKALIEQALQNLKNSGVSNMEILDFQELEGGLMTVISGTMQNQAIKAALVAFVNSNSMTLAGFNAPSNRFDELGGVALIFVTVGGHDPAQYGASTSQNNATNANAAIDPLCIDPNDDIFYTMDYCVFERLTKSGPRQPVDSRYLYGAWEYAMSVPANIWNDMSNSYQNIATGQISYDSSGSAISINLYNNGKYEIIYLYDITSGGCNSKVKAYEAGSYQFDGLNLSLSNGTYQNTIAACGQSENTYNGVVNPDIVTLVFENQDKLFLQFDCNVHQYIAGCNDYGKRLFGLTRAR